tara:strand:+ start:2523 stop:2840 length:318 start_codon:yes stop_codon:yes gene_type:complete
MSIPIMLKNKVIGKVQNGVFIKNVIGSKHFLRKPPAISLDKSTLVEAVKNGANRVEINDTSSKNTYKASIDRIMIKGFEIDRGYGKQLALMLNQWDKNERTSSNN